MIYFTSDTHFHHENIIDYCDRPFDNIFLMNEALVKNWNETVDENDTVYHLGDVGYTSQTHETLDRLKGKKILVMGNHDDSLSRQKLEDNFDYVHEDPVVNLTVTNKQGKPAHEYHGYGLECISVDLDDRFYLDIPMAHNPRDRSNHTFTIIGHVHDNFKFLSNRLNVGVDVWGFKPVEIDKILKYYKKNLERREYCMNQRGFYDEWARIEELKSKVSKIKNLIGEINNVFE